MALNRQESKQVFQTTICYGGTAELRSVPAATSLWRLQRMRQAANSDAFRGIEGCEHE